MAPQVRYSAEPGFDPAKTNYTVLLVDPDAPSPNAPALRFFLHQVQCKCFRPAYLLLPCSPTAPPSTNRLPNAYTTLTSHKDNTHPNCISGAVVASPAGTNGENSVPYMLLTPASVAKHRYIFLVYRQPNGNEPKTNLVDKTARAPFDLAKFVRDNRLTLVGGNFLTEGLESVGARSVERFEGLEMEEEA